MSKRIIIPAYDPYPGPEWEAIFDHAADVYAVILNPASGPGGAQEAPYVAMRARLKAAGILVLGYLATAYGEKPYDQVKAELINWSTFYQPDGVFYDECSSDKDKLSYYNRIHGMARGILGQSAVVVINPGTFPDEEFMEVADIVCCVETDQEAFVSKKFPAWMDWHPPEKFYTIVFSVTNPGDVMEGIDLHRSKYLYLTTAVPAPGASGPEFNIPDTIWPTLSAPVTTETGLPPMDATSEESWAVLTLTQVSRILGSSVTLEHLPAHAESVMSEINRLRIEVARVTLTDEQLLDEIRRRFKS